MGGLFEWLLRHAADTLNKRQPGRDGKTPWMRLHGRMYKGELVPFGCRVLARMSGTIPVECWLTDGRMDIGLEKLT